MKGKYIVFFAIISGVFGASGCSDAVDALTGNYETCEVALTSSQCNGNTIEACADNYDGWYEVNGSYYCSYTSGGSSCAQSVVNAYCTRPAARGADSSESDLLVELLSTKADNQDLQRQVQDLMDTMNKDLVSSQGETE